MPSPSVSKRTPVPVTVGDASPALLVKLTLPLNVAALVGLKRTVRSCVSLAARLKELSPTILNGALVLALPVSVPPPVFWTVKARSFVVPAFTLEKLRDGGLTAKTGDGVVTGTGVSKNARLTPL